LRVIGRSRYAFAPLGQSAEAVHWPLCHPATFCVHHDAQIIRRAAACGVGRCKLCASSLYQDIEQIMSEVSQSVSELISQLGKLPGIGRKSAERLAYYILRMHKDEALALADAIRNVKENVRHCRTCYNLAEGDQCAICLDPRRKQDLLCVVEQPRDLLALEQAGVYDGLYHVLLGRISPLDGIGPEQLTIDALVRRVREGAFKEVIMATNPTVEGDGTALYISNLLRELPVRISRLARGVTPGSVLEFANKEILADAMTGRQEF